nr:3'(2'),5'-bisphosphate nucleotidase CysQ [Prochlorococcus sp. MIT 1300]
MSIEPCFPKGVDLEVLLTKLRFLSWGASAILRAYARGQKPPYGFPEALDIQNGGEGPVSAADLAVNKWLIDGLQENFPHANWTLLSEETAKEQLKEGEPIAAEWLWILDPLDGTRDFLQGTGQYAVHLGLVHNNQPLLGVVLLPELEELWLGVVGVGAWCEDITGNRSSVMFSQRRKLRDLIIVSSRNHRDFRLEKLIEKLDLGGTKSIGSVGCKIATILRGEADLYLSLSGKSAPKDWDMAAPEALLRAAGGAFTHVDLAPLEYNTGDVRQSGCLLASHGLNHTEICQLILREIQLIDPDFSV